MSTETPTEVPAWLKIAAGEIGLKEIAGPVHNPRILAYLQSTSCPAPYRNADETPWCGAFVNWCMTEAGYPGAHDAAAAKAWLGYGEPLPWRYGAITVVTRGAGLYHVAFTVDFASIGRVKLLGGNQGDSVSSTWVGASRVVGYRWPSPPPKVA